MIDASVLLKALQRLEKELEEDLRTRVTPDAAASPQEQAVATELDAKLRTEYREAKEGGRTGQAFEVWRDEFLTQVAVAWILGCVFVRFMEDNGLVEMPQLSGPGERRQRALDQHELYFKDPERRTHSDREYLLDVFEQTQKLPAAREIFDAQHNPLWTVGLSGDGATKLLQFWQRLDPDTGGLDHDFTDPDWNTRFLGDLYQDLSESARKKYALLQTPEFVEEFILDRTLMPAIEEFGFQEVRLIDPTCGSGHFLLGAFHRLFELWLKQEPGANPRELVQRALGQVYGVDLNPFAVAIARFRLLVEALKTCGVKRLSDAPAFRENLAVGDSLLHGKRPGMLGARQEFLDSSEDPLRHVYQTEDAEALRRILGQQYHAVVGNPPYITVKDKALNGAYRERFGSCHGKYSLAVPFMERFFDLALSPELGVVDPAGFIGMITANSFMKQQFGKKLVEGFLPRWDLTHVVDTSGAYIPGHGTPTVLLIGRHRGPVGENVRAVMGIRGEPSTPVDPSRGLVWSAIREQIDHVGSQSTFVSVSDIPRGQLERHPWSISGGGAAELKAQLDETVTSKLGDLTDAIGFVAIPGEGDVFVAPGRSVWLRIGIHPDHLSDLVDGESVRDWQVREDQSSIYPYDKSGQFVGCPSADQHLWRYRTVLQKGLYFGKTRNERGLDWRSYAIVVGNKFHSTRSIVFSSVATHNHFVFDKGGKVFTQSSPVIKLPPDSDDAEHIGLLGLLNSSTACFWMKQVFHNKGSTVDQHGARQRTAPFEDFYDHSGTKLKRFPVPTERPLPLARRLQLLAQERSLSLPASIVEHGTPSAHSLEQGRLRAEEIREQMIALQEELDWSCYRIYGIAEGDFALPEGELIPLKLGERASEIVLSRKIAAGEAETTWFERHASTPITELPPAWPAEYRALVERRIKAIETVASIALIERPEFKRRWNDEPWESQKERALRNWLLDRLESGKHWKREQLTSTAKMADSLREDPDFLQVAEQYVGHPDFNVETLVAKLIDDEAAPLLPQLRYTASGLRKREVYEETWKLQRREDAIDARTQLPEPDPDHVSARETITLKASEVGEIPVPPKYKPADFQEKSYWRLRGKLDVPKERFVSFPHCEREADPSLVVGWAGWNQLELAQATAAYYLEMKEQEGWPAERLTPLLTALLELLPWVKQWHNSSDPEHGVRMGDYFDDFINEEARALGSTIDQIESWTPPKKKRARKPRKKPMRKTKIDTEVITT